MYELLTVADRILLVGEGDFSFSVSLYKNLAVTESLQLCIVSTSYESEATILKHRYAQKNISWLRERGVKVLLDVDARKLHDTEFLDDGCCPFTKIIFNFPHVGGKSNIKRNRELLNDFFLSAVKVLSSDGQILMTLCRGQGGTPADQPQRKWNDSWKVTLMAAIAGLILTQTSNFSAEDHFDYSSTGFRSRDQQFHTKGAITHVFEKAESVSVPREISPALITFEGHVYQCFKYLHTRTNRCVYKDQGHPCQQIYERLTSSLSEIVTCKSMLPTNFKEILSHDVNVSYTPLSTAGEKGEQELKELTDETHIDGNVHGPFCYYLRRCEKNNCDLLENQEIIPFIERGLEYNLLVSTKCSINNSFPDSKHEGFHSLENHQKETKTSPKEIDEMCNELKGGADFHTLPSFVHTPSNVHLRFSLLEHIDEILLNSSKNELTFLCGSTFCPCLIKLDKTPFEQEMVGVMKGDNCDFIIQELIAILQKVYCDVALFETATFEEISVKKNVMWTMKSHQTIMTRPSHGMADDKNLCFDREQGTIGRVWKVFNEREAKVEAVAFTINLVKLSNIVFQIDDIRLLWSLDSRVCEQWKTGKTPNKIRKISLYPLSFCHDKSFWKNTEMDFDEFTFCDIIRDICGDGVCGLKLIDAYEDFETKDVSYCYRLTFQSCDQAFSYDTSWQLQSLVRLEVQKQMGIQLR